MKKLVLGVAALFAGAVIAFGAEPVMPTAPIELFNGKDLTGWVAHRGKSTNTTETWAVKDGLLINRGKPNGYLRTETTFKEFRVAVEWRFTKPGNAGVVVHINGEDKVWPKCIECQGMNKRQGDFWIWGGAQVAEQKDKKPGVPRTKPDAEKAVGEWNTFEVVCKGDTVAILVNGTEVNRVTGSNVTSGQIALQAEGGEQEIRKVTVSPL